ncbi:MAG: glycosyltransferase family 2 protein [Clostridia bacterium]|nr:glycosyltransferase family 2 protein [Clostridia bacterium]
MSDNIEVSVICNAYNHEKYIAQALESFIMQRTNFKFEVLVHDDASTDSTADIIREYEKKYPDLIKPMYQTVNQYSNGGAISKRFQLPRARGRYIAVCEGDDYWTDPEKLQKQYDQMEKNPQADMCTHSSVVVDARSGSVIKRIARRDHTCIIPLEEVIAGGGSFVSTNSLFYRKALLDNEPPFRQILRLDYSMQVLGALRGGILYIADEMSAYRANVENSWTQVSRSSSLKKKQHFNKVNLMLKQLDKDTNGKYHWVIFKHRLKNWLKQRSLGFKALREKK